MLNSRPENFSVFELILDVDHVLALGKRDVVGGEFLVWESGKTVAVTLAEVFTTLILSTSSQIVPIRRIFLALTDCPSLSGSQPIFTSVKFFTTGVTDAGARPVTGVTDLLPMS